MLIDHLTQDVRYAIRSYARTPIFAAVVLTTLALGIGASTAIFSLVNGILIRPLPLPDPDRLAYVNEVGPAARRISVSWPNFLDWRARARSFDELALSRDESLTWTGVERPQRLTGRRVTANFFDALRVGAAVGRTFASEDDRPGANPVVVVSHGFWRSQLGADPAALGRMLHLDGVAHMVVGILPAGFRYLRPYDLFAPMGPIVTEQGLLDRGNHNGFSAVARMKPGVTLESAGRELAGISADLQREHPDTNSGVTTTTELLAARLVADVRLTLLALLGAVGCLLLMACVNVANLLVARGTARRHELAVRAALGGGRLRLVSQLLVESMLLSAAGAALGIALATWLLRVLIAFAPDGTPRIDDVHLDATAVAFALAAAVVCGLVFGAFPAFQASGISGQQTLVRTRSAGASIATHKVRRGLMVVEVALALVLLTGAGLMVRTLQQLTHVDTGFRSERLLTQRISLVGDQWTPARRVPFYDDLLARLRALPGVTAAALAFSLPIDGSNWNSIFIAADKPVPPRAELPSAAFTPVSAGYFETMGMRLTRGRLFGTPDAATAPPTAVVNDTLARRIWPGEDPIGKRLKQGWPESPGTWREVVGVVADVKFEGVAAETPLQVYLPLTQESVRSMAIVIRTAADPGPLQVAVEDAVHGLNKDLPVYRPRTMDQILEQSMARERMSMLVLMVFAVVALTLASVGLYGVVSHGVAERTHEIGVRMALGAEARHVVALVVRQGLTAALAGTILGVASGLVLSRAIRDLLFGIAPTDPATFGGVVVLLLGVAFVACYLPARRATRVDPTAALRAE